MKCGFQTTDGAPEQFVPQRFDTPPFTQKQLAEQLGVSQQVVSNRLREMGKIQNASRWVPPYNTIHYKILSLSAWKQFRNLTGLI